MPPSRNRNHAATPLAPSAESWIPYSDDDATNEWHLRALQAAIDSHKRSSTRIVPDDTTLALGSLPRPVFEDRFCLGCNQHQNNFTPASLFMASYKSFRQLEKKSIQSIAVMSRKALLQQFRPIACAFLCRKCIQRGRIERITNPWVDDIRKVIAILKDRGTQTQTLMPHQVIDLTRTASSHEKNLECIICTDPIDDDVAKQGKACFQCGGVVHKKCFDTYRTSLDLTQMAARTTEREILHLPCVFCRCVILSVPRTKAGMANWDRRVKEEEEANATFARREQLRLDQAERDGDSELWGDEGRDSGSEYGEDADTVILE